MLADTRKRAVVETKLLLAQPSESLLSKFKLHYETHESEASMLRLLKRLARKK